MGEQSTRPQISRNRPPVRVVRGANATQPPSGTAGPPREKRCPLFMSTLILSLDKPQCPAYNVNVLTIIQGVG
jgi:hypothetical protein